MPCEFLMTCMTALDGNVSRAFVAAFESRDSKFHDIPGTDSEPFMLEEMMLSRIACCYIAVTKG